MKNDEFILSESVYRLQAYTASGLKLSYTIPEGSLLEMQRAHVERTPAILVTATQTMVGIDPQELSIWFANKIADPIDWTQALALL